MSTETIWIGIGFLGQGLFFGRWLIQWIASERSAESRVPIAFWYMSLIGGLIRSLTPSIEWTLCLFQGKDSGRSCIYAISSSFTVEIKPKTRLVQQHEKLGNQRP